MYYLILSWKDAVEQMIEEEHTLERLRCPLCSKQFETHEYLEAVKHLKSCYTTRRIKNELFRDRHMSRLERIANVSHTANQVEQEINRYLNGLSYECHLF